MKRFSLGAIVLAVVLALRGAAAGVCTGATYCSSDSDCDQAATEYCDLSTQTCQYLSCTINSDCVEHPCSNQEDCLCDSGTYMPLGLLDGLRASRRASRLRAAG